MINIAIGLFDGLTAYQNGGIEVTWEIVSSGLAALAGVISFLYRQQLAASKRLIDDKDEQLGKKDQIIASRDATIDELNVKLAEQSKEASEQLLQLFKQAIETSANATEAISNITASIEGLKDSMDLKREIERLTQNERQ